MKGRDLRRVTTDVEARRPASLEQAAERAHRGRALVEQARLAARAGQPPPPLPAGPAAPVPAPRVEATACARCYRPHEAPPNTLCPVCAADDPQPLDDLDALPITTPGETAWS